MIDIFAMSKEGFVLEESGARPSHDQFVKLCDYEELKAELAASQAEIAELKASNERLKEAYKKANDLYNAAGDSIHYDKCWDRAAYPTLAEALEHLTFCGMPECKAKLEADAIRKAAEQLNSVHILSDDHTSYLACAHWLVDYADNLEGE